MVLELHVLGPAFNLPSIDAECTASIAACKLRFGNNASEWTIRACHDEPDALPALHDGERWVYGFSNIMVYLGRVVQPEAAADAIAITSLIETRAPVLIAAYMYLSYENYSSTTRPAFTEILPLYARFVIPAHIRSIAKERTSALGIDSLDIEALDERHASADGRQPVGSESTFEAPVQQRTSLLLPNVKTVRSLLAQRPERLAAFKLKNLADSFLEPLQDALGTSDFLLGDEPCDVDCLAYAYLGLMINPKVPQPWLCTMVQEHYPKLFSYVQRMETRLDLGSNGSLSTSLPWSKPEAVNVAGVFRALGSMIAKRGLITSSAVVSSQFRASDPYQMRFWSGLFFVTGSTLVAGASWMIYNLLRTSHGDPVQIFGQRKLPEFTHVSSALSGLDLGFAASPHNGRPHVHVEDGAPARVGIELEP